MAVMRPGWSQIFHLLLWIEISGLPIPAWHKHFTPSLFLLYCSLTFLRAIGHHSSPTTAKSNVLTLMAFSALPLL